ncbi:hypothetical protein [Azospirillum isscasi]|uniref:Uncharacterized protein n=1 Tax=Azospirillum isscasi TaxID=3053926 RepID=A0ABU0WD04_9PROT|nr:hypothetical protein [Azospirillum isscasi]MDQ2101972.1 hypothetical protein [Azospirillum isscasi]
MNEELVEGRMACFNLFDERTGRLIPLEGDGPWPFPPGSGPIAEGAPFLERHEGAIALVSPMHGPRIKINDRLADGRAVLSANNKIQMGDADFFVFLVSQQVAAAPAEKLETNKILKITSLIISVVSLFVPLIGFSFYFSGYTRDLLYSPINVKVTFGLGIVALVGLVASLAYLLAAKNNPKKEKTDNLLFAAFTSLSSLCSVFSIAYANIDHISANPTINYVGRMSQTIMTNNITCGIFGCSGDDVTISSSPYADPAPGIGLVVFALICFVNIFINLLIINPKKGLANIFPSFNPVPSISEASSWDARHVKRNRLFMTSALVHYFSLIAVVYLSTIHGSLAPIREDLNRRISYNENYLGKEKARLDQEISLIKRNIQNYERGISECRKFNFRHCSVLIYGKSPTEAIRSEEQAGLAMSNYLVAMKTKEGELISEHEKRKEKFLSENSSRYGDGFLGNIFASILPMTCIFLIAFSFSWSVLRVWRIRGTAPNALVRP